MKTRALVLISLVWSSALGITSSMALAQDGHTRAEVECVNNTPHVDERTPHNMTPDDLSSPCEGEVIGDPDVFIFQASCSGISAIGDLNVGYSMHCRNHREDAFCRLRFICGENRDVRIKGDQSNTIEASEFNCITSDTGHSQVGVHPDTGKGFFKCGNFTGELECV